MTKLFKFYWGETQYPIHMQWVSPTIVYNLEGGIDTITPPKPRILDITKFYGISIKGVLIGVMITKPRLDY